MIMKEIVILVIYTIIITISLNFLVWMLIRYIRWKRQK